MLKILLLLVLAGFVWLAWKKSHKPPAANPPAERPVEQMVACAHCGVHLPTSDAVVAGELHYCCQAHLAAGARSGRQ